jgi:3-hydroxyisobutyrate dehydrogenase-like beta-hydroxyacid dehydrogenase
MAMERLAVIGFGEAGSTFASAGNWGSSARSFDILPERSAVMESMGVAACGSLPGAVSGADLILSLVTADAALDVALGAAPHVAVGALFCDMNSVAPGTKRAAAEAIDAAGGRYVDVAVMAPVRPKCLAVPLLLSGPHAEAGRKALAALGFTDLRVVGEDVGRASTIKMLRSVMYKGVEALTAECLIACERAGVTDEVLSSFGNDWASGADYRFDRMLVHGMRRAAELREVCKTLEGLGLPPSMSSGTVAWQEILGNFGVLPAPEGLAAKLAAIAEADTLKGED